MDIPLKISIPIALKPLLCFHIAKFQDIKMKNPKPHWYLLIRVVDTDSFIVVLVTSQKTNRISYYKNSPKPKAARCLVSVNNNDFDFLSRDSAINCNDAELLSIPEIVLRVDKAKGFKIEKEKVEAYLRRDIVSAIIRAGLAKLDRCISEEVAL